MSVSASNTMNQYTLNLTRSYTKCCACQYDIAFSKDALLCSCKKYCYCSPQCRDKINGAYCRPEMVHEGCNTYNTFLCMVQQYHPEDIETVNMVEEYISSKTGVSRIDIKKLAESGDWKAALILGLTYEFRFVCEREECQLAIRPPFPKCRLFSNRKAIKYYNMAAEQNFVEAFAGLARTRTTLMDQSRANKDYHLKCVPRFKSLEILRNLCFYELSLELEAIKKEYKEGEELEVPLSGLMGILLFRLNCLKPNSSILKEFLRFPPLAEGYSLLKACNPEALIFCVSNEFKMSRTNLPRPVECIIYIQKADILVEKDKAKIDHGVRMDTKAVFDPGYFQRLHRDQPLYYCEHGIESAGNICTQCSQLARERIYSSAGEKEYS